MTHFVFLCVREEVWPDWHVFMPIYFPLCPRKVWPDCWRKRLKIFTDRIWNLDCGRTKGVLNIWPNSWFNWSCIVSSWESSSLPDNGKKSRKESALTLQEKFVLAVQSVENHETLNFDDITLNLHFVGKEIVPAGFIMISSFEQLII